MLAEFRWTISRGRDTYGYNICSLYIDGAKVSSCSGGGYDMEGTALATWMREKYADRLWSIRGDAHSASYRDASRPSGWAPVELSPKGRKFYGFTVNYNDAQQQAGSVHVDGACGMSSVQTLANAIGLTFKYQNLGARVKNRSAYIVEDSGKF